MSEVVISPDGTWLATGSADRSVRIWSRMGERPIATLRTETSLHACTWLSAGTPAAAGGSGLHVYDTLTA